MRIDRSRPKGPDPTARERPSPSPSPPRGREGKKSRRLLFFPPSGNNRACADAGGYGLFHPMAPHPRNFGAVSRALVQVPSLVGLPGRPRRAAPQGTTTLLTFEVHHRRAFVSVSVAKLKLKLGFMSSAAMAASPLLQRCFGPPAVAHGHLSAHRVGLQRRLGFRFHICQSLLPFLTLPKDNSPGPGRWPGPARPPR